MSSAGIDRVILTFKVPDKDCLNYSRVVDQSEATMSMKEISRSAGGRKRTCLTDILILVALVGAFLFAKGFLQVRTLIEDKSRCDQPPIAPQLSKGHPPSTCWLPVTRRKIILVVVDALRIDFAMPSSAFADKSLAWYDKLTVLHEIASKFPRDATLFHFVADPPTATTQRLSALAAGTLPAFVQVASNFAENSLGSDNFIYQLLSHPAYQRLHLYGDDTWLNLFPIIKEKSKGVIAGYHSFHLFDLDTVDNGIKKHLYPALEQNDFDVIIAHFLGFDHCGHKYGPALTPCGDKLTEMDSILRKVIQDMDDETQLIVMGDHGMTDNGDHGGISPKEISSVLFTYRKSKVQDGRLPDADFWNLFSHRTNEIRKRLLDIKDDEYFFQTNNVASLRGSVTQIDFTPTISLLAGIPIAFGNVGSIIPELLVDFDWYLKEADFLKSRIANLRFLVEAVRMNAWQINNLIQKCRQMGENGFERGEVDLLLDKLRVAEERSLSNKEETSDVLKEIFFLYYEFTVDSQIYFRRIWADFGMGSIISGIGLGWLAVCFNGLIFLVKCRKSVGSLCAMLLGILHSLALSATSFVTFEDWMVRFMLTTLVLIETAQSFSADKPGMRTLGLMMALVLLIRASALCGSCREEQFPYCQGLNHRSIPTFFTLLLTVAMIIAGMSMVLWRLSNVLKQCNAKIWEHFLWVATVSLLSLHLVRNWIADTSNVLEGSHELVEGFFNLGLPRMLFSLCLFLVVFYWKRGKLMMLAVACLTTIVLRPLAGFVQVTGGYLIMDLGQELFISNSALSSASFFYLAGLHLFFTSGHQMTLTNLQWEAAFVGIRSTVQSIAGLLMALNTFSGPILATVSMLHWEAASNETLSGISVFLWHCVAQLIATASFAAVLMRHLMVWKMFTPRFVLQALLVLQVLAILVVFKGTQYTLQYFQPNR